MAKVVTSGFDVLDRTFANMGRKVDAASRSTLTAAAKLAVAEARAHAPVYAGPRRDVPRGRLRASIKAGRVRMVAPGLWEVTVRSVGFPAQAYVAAEEARHPFLDPAGRKAELALPALALVAVSKALEV